MRPSASSKSKLRLPLRRGIQTAALGLFLYLFFYVSWPYAKVFHSRLLSEKEWLPVEAFLWLDPLVGVSTSIAARTVNVALFGTAFVFLASVLIPRGFCGYICPLGTLVDLCDWLVGRRVRPLGARMHGWWGRLTGAEAAAEENLHASAAAERTFRGKTLRYTVLIIVLVAAGCGAMLGGYVSAIPLLTRAAAFTLGPLQLGWVRDWSQVRSADWDQWFSVGLFLLVFVGTVAGRRFWCRHLCPSGALLSLFSLFRLTQRKVEESCIECGLCAKVCAFDAVEPDYTTRPLDCTWCQTCGRACPVGAITFGGRFGRKDVRQSNPGQTTHGASRREFLVNAACGAAGIVACSAAAQRKAGPILLRPPGSLPEPRFLELCIRCGQCYQVCPGPVLHPAGWDVPLDLLWTPVPVLTHAGCHQDCNFCTQICPTGAIRPLSIEQKRKTSMGLAKINCKTCLPHAGREDCRLCVDECDAAGYRAIGLRPVELPMENIPEGVFSEEELEQMGRIDAPFIDPEACVGCGLCEYRCHAALVKQQKLLGESAIRVVPERVDR